MTHRKVVVLTGATSGIGRATAERFAARGARLVLAARGDEGLALVREACQRAGAEVITVATDVSDESAVAELAAAAYRRFGSIDVWINNVGVGLVGKFDEAPMSWHRRIIEVNLIGHMNGAHAALRRFRAQGQGVLVNIISIGGLASAPYAAAYTASKFGLRGFSESLRAEVSDLPGVHVCEVYPTFVDTPGLLHGANRTGRRLKPPPPVLDPREVAAVVVELADTPRDSVSVGSVAWPARIAHALAPDLVGRVTKWLFDAALARARPARLTDGNLFKASVGHEIDGGFRNRGVGTLLLWSGVGLLVAAAAAALVTSSKAPERGR